MFVILRSFSPPDFTILFPQSRPDCGIVIWIFWLVSQKPLEQITKSRSLWLLYKTGWGAAPFTGGFYSKYTRGAEEVLRSMLCSFGYEIQTDLPRVSQEEPENHFRHPASLAIAIGVLSPYGKDASNKTPWLCFLNTSASRFHNTKRWKYLESYNAT